MPGKEINSELALKIAKSLETSLKEPFLQKDNKTIEGYRYLYKKITEFHDGKFKHLKDKIDSLKYGKEALDEATEEQLRRTFEVEISMSKENKQYYQENKDFMKAIYDRLMAINKGTWLMYYRDLMELPND